MRKVLMIGLLAGALLGGGCGGDDDDAANGGGGGGGGQKQEGAVDGTGYSFVPPDKWRDASDAFEGSAIKIDLAYVEPEPEAGFGNNVNVIRETPNGLDADRLDDYGDEFRRQASTQASEAGLSETEKTELDGEPALTWDFDSASADPKVHQKQVVTIHDDALYTITWSARADAYDETTADLQGMLDSWRWSGG